MKRFLQIVLAIGIVAIVAAILFPVFATAKTGGKSVCFNQLRAIAISFGAYAADFDDRFPNRDRWVDTMSDYSRSQLEYRCPEVAKGRNPNLYGYAFNSRLSNGKTPEDVKNVPLIYDSINLARNASDPVTSLPDPPRHRWGTANYMAYADGHARPLRKKS